MNDPHIDRLLRLVLVEGRDVPTHGGLSVAEHSVQAAALAWKASAPLTLVAAALLHDVGLLVDEMFGNDGGLDLDPRHEVMGADILEPVLGAAVAEPVRLHEAAGRYLVATDPTYLDSMNEGVRDELLSAVDGLQEIMSEPERHALAAHPWGGAALRLRHWDDASYARRAGGLALMGRSELYEILDRARRSARPISA